MSMSAAQQPSNSGADNTVLAIILATSMGHFLNDMMQSLLPAIYPMLKDNYSLSFWQIGLLTFTFQMTASILQPLVGIYPDRKPMPYSLPFGMGCTLVGLVFLATAHHYSILLLGAAFVGFGSSVFHPEAARVARLASGGRHGFAQSLFQVGGNFGSSIGPLLAAFIVLPFGQISVSWFSVAALIGMMLLWYVSNWYNRYRIANASKAKPDKTLPLPRNKVLVSVGVLAMLVFTKYIYMASLTSYYTFYTISHFGVSVQSSQLLLFLFLGAVAAGTIIGGPIGDRCAQGDLGIDPRRPAVHACPALCQPRNDGYPDGHHRPDPRLGLPGHRGIRTGIAAGTRRHGVGPVLRFRIRHGRYCRRRPRRRG